MYKPNLAQFKLTSGHEVVCELISEEDFSDDSSGERMKARKLGDNEILARNILMIVPIEYNGERKFMFRPFLQYVESSEDIVILNSSHIVSMNRPNVMLANDYKIAIVAYQEEHEERRKNYLYEIARHLTKVQNSLDRQIQNWSEDSDFDDPSGVIIPFPNKNDKLIH